MRRLRRALGDRPAVTGLITLVGAAMLALLIGVPAFGAPPSQECADPAWNGEYWKIEVDDRNFETVGDPETSLSAAEGTISLTIEKQGNKGVVTWSNHTDFGVFRIYEKYGRLADEITDASFPPGGPYTFEVQRSISHITLCFGEAPDPDIDIVKETNGDDHSTASPNYVAAGDPVTWTYTVTNEGNVPLANVQVTDDIEGMIAGPASGDTDGDEMLDVDETWTYSHEGTADPTTSTWDGGALNGYANTGTATAEFGETQVTDSDGSGYYASDPSITIECSVDDNPCDGGVTVNAGDPIVWTFVIENDGNVPLGAVIVKQDGTQLDSCALEDGTSISPCDLGMLNPDEIVTVIYTQDTDAGDAGDQVTSFVVAGADPLSNVADETTGNLSFTVNSQPVAVDDSYEMNERADENQAAILEVAAPGVLGNDMDDDGDPLTASDPTAPTNGGSAVLNGDGSFTYTPATDYPWVDDEFSRVDTWDYTVSDGNGGSDIGTVEITVNRVICTDETVSAEDGDVFGAFTLLSTSNPDEPCKAYAVAASEGETTEDDLITLTVPGDGNEAAFRGELTFSPEPLDDNDDFVLSLEYDPDNEGEEPFRPLLICESATFEGGLVVDATIPEGETWCNAGWVSRASNDVAGEINTLVQVFGKEDPGFSVR